MKRPEPCGGVEPTERHPPRDHSPSTETSEVDRASNRPVHVGRRGRAVTDVAAELGADWHAVNDAVMAYGQALLAADDDRVGQVEALGVDEVLFGRLGPWQPKPGRRRPSMSPLVSSST